MTDDPDFFTVLNDAARQAEEELSAAISDQQGNEGKVFQSPGRFTYEGPAWGQNNSDSTASFEILDPRGGYDAKKVSLNRAIRRQIEISKIPLQAINIRITVEFEERKSNDDETTQAS